MASWVKWLAVPGPPPGPCDAKAAWAHSTLATVDAAIKAKRDVRCLALNGTMTIFCDEKFSEDTGDSLRLFLRTFRKNVFVRRGNRFVA
jgi:hypothetical protein